MHKKIVVFITLLLILFFSNTYALEINDLTVLINNQITKKLNDHQYTTKEDISNDYTINIKSNTLINHVYIIYELTSATGTLRIGNEKLIIGKNGYLHEYIDVSKYASNEISINYDSNVTISEIYVFDNNNLPTWVQQWQKLKRADLMIMPTHSDDEHLFFAGLIPTYLNKGAKIQIVYLTNHNDNPQRLHEQLDGLWATGLTYYPVIGLIPDAYSVTLEEALKSLTNSGFSLEDIIKFQVDNIRKYKPLIIVGHDEKGEYGHGQHMLNTYALKKALEKTNNQTYYNNYEVYDVPKVYLHLYKEKPIIMNYDIPLAKYNNNTAYEISKLGYQYHKSQHYTWFTDWLLGKNNTYNKATEIKKYSPTEFGLYKSSVGDDIMKNDMLENIPLRKNYITSEFTIYKLYKKDNIGFYLVIDGLLNVLLVISMIFLIKELNNN